VILNHRMMASGAVVIAYRPHMRVILPLSAGDQAQLASRQVGRPSRGEIGKACAAGASRLIAPRAIGRQSDDKVVEQDFGSVFCRQPSQAIRASTLAHVAAQADHDVREVDQPPKAHSVAQNEP
jgi:hypothetical protein